MQRWGYSLATGEMLWGPTDPEPAFNFYSMDYDFFGTRSYIYNGMLLSVGYGGVLIAYNITTGEVLWKYTAQGVGFESPYGNYPLNIAAIADGKLYVITGEHSITQPMWRAFLRCIDAETGEELWKILQFGADGGANLSGMTVFMADGYVVGLNYYDNKIYCYGKGPSKTTVTAGPKVSALGSKIVVEGTVTDQSPGTEQLEQANRFPNGVPAIADEYQEDWMEYVYMQQVRPQCVEGVEVVLTTYDPNGNTYEIGRTTSSDIGTFGCEVDLPVPGLYKIIATFEGSDAYYASSAETYVSVTEAPTAGQPMEPELVAPEPVVASSDITVPTETAIPAETSSITTEIAILVAVTIACIIGLINLWALRKRK
jgi:outer membrane protein assembly factor BamB